MENVGINMLTPYHSQKFQKLTQHIGDEMAEYALVGLTKDGIRSFRLKLGFNQRTASHNRYQKYIRLLGQLSDIILQIKQQWEQYKYQKQELRDEEEDEQDSEIDP